MRSVGKIELLRTDGNVQLYLYLGTPAACVIERPQGRKVSGLPSIQEQ